MTTPRGLREDRHGVRALCRSATKGIPTSQARKAIFTIWQVKVIFWGWTKVLRLQAQDTLGATAEPVGHKATPDPVTTAPADRSTGANKL
jgi:hypothetical protein